LARAPGRARRFDDRRPVRREARPRIRVEDRRSGRRRAGGRNARVLRERTAAEIARGALGNTGVGAVAVVRWNWHAGEIMLSDIEIAQRNRMKRIAELARDRLGI